MFHASMTHHAMKRMQQRGIPERVLPLLFEYGEEAYDHRGTATLYFTKRSRQRLASIVPRDELKRLSNALNAYVVVDQDGAVVTVGHRTQRINHD
ncbi:hypothetical protein OPU71_00525 [Niveibacterium sp. 24ML]|uniref:hypothetical protein n=1 Tax=Niveibacterium sp. 24ML TaxID=2985512 RepID=UPI0022710942|nr:hypothetical protein [Niveibacterium sp. 24ML]MCX9154603.1 hypothetical protein [Niveibacterium sp. 24ML]